MEIAKMERPIAAQIEAFEDAIDGLEDYEHAMIILPILECQHRSATVSAILKNS